MAQFESAQWTDDSRTEIRAVREDGTVVTVPADPGNADYLLITEGLPAIEGRDSVAPMDVADPN